jgi:hypothetical protein
MNKFLLLVLPIFWSGFSMALAFLEAPIKFQAPGITLPLGLGIGKLVFHASHLVQVGFLVLLGLYSFMQEKMRWCMPIFLFIGVATCFLFQHLYCLPKLDLRADEIIAQNILQSHFSITHQLYVLCEIFKNICLWLCAYLAYKHA